ncbi:hypothetical protein KVP10_06515 [Candidimonas humi]|uniref:Uncharacterized protein n=1 Tax=Candidimonas humi TaxID=683355 RepID=A0ABV8NVH9_9BURK|nr:hypothetical protein [Candidimonas humi]MBV6304532.1 hypothetical protein [Candidimonas humi]
MGIENEVGAGDDLVESAQGWAQRFAAAPLNPSDAGDLVAGALKASVAVSRAAAQLTWLTQDSFVDAMRRKEHTDGN